MTNALDGAVSTGGTAVSQASTQGTRARMARLWHSYCTGPPHSFLSLAQISTPSLQHLGKRALLTRDLALSPALRGHRAYPGIYAEALK